MCESGSPLRPRLRAGSATLAAVALLVALGCAPGRQPPASGSPPTGAPAAPSPAAAPAPLPPTDWADEVLYFVVLDRFADGDASNNRAVDPSAKGAFHGGDLAGLRQGLGEIAELGATAVWITPLVDNIDGFVTGAGFPDWAYHGYWADDFSRLDPRFGTEAELVALVAEAHARGIRVLLDVVYNHAGYDSRYLEDARTAGWLRSEERGTCGSDDLTSCLSGLPDFRTEHAEVADYLMDHQLGWARRAGLDGFRLDTVKHVDHPFWREHRRRTREELFPGFFLLGEVWGGDAEVLDPWFAGDEMDGGFDFSFQGSTLGWVQGRGRTVAYDRYLKGRERVRDGFLLAHFLSSHDTPGALFQLGGDVELFRLAAALQMTTAGLPVVYYGEEVARPGGDWPENRGDMPWGERPLPPGAGLPRDEALRADYRRLIAIRRAHPALWRGVHESVSTEGDVLVFARRDPGAGATEGGEGSPRPTAEAPPGGAGKGAGEVVIVAVNRGREPAPISVTAPAGWLESGVARDEWTGEELLILAPGSIGAPSGAPEAPFVTFEVPARGFRILAAAP